MNVSESGQQAQQIVKSENGGSTNLSEGSNEIDEEFKIKNGEKFEFINENINEWPQWSVDQSEKEPVKLEAEKSPKELEKLELDALVTKIRDMDNALENDYQFMFNRGMSFPIRSIPKSSVKKESIFSGIAKKVKGFFK